MSPPDAPRILVVGAGPAGLSAALWLADFGVPFDWIDSAGEVGGMLRRVHNRIENHVGADFDNGEQFCEAMKLQRRARKLPLRRAKLTALRCTDPTPTAVVDEVPVSVERILLATGTSYRLLGVAGEEEGLGHYVSQSATADASRFSGKPVAVVGGGDAGFENALRLADHGCTVTLLLRSSPRARPGFRDAVDAHPAIDIAPIPSVIRRIDPTEMGCRLQIDRQDCALTLNVACLFVRIGVEPVLPRGCESLQTDERGFVVVDADGRSSHSSIFAAGDITSTPLRSVATAAGLAARAARCVADELGYLGDG